MHFIHKKHNNSKSVPSKPVPPKPIFPNPKSSPPLNQGLGSTNVNQIKDF